MGLEARCAVRWNGQSWQAAVHLDSQALEVRGRPRLMLPLSEVVRVQHEPGGLGVETARGLLELGLGDAAEAWARKILAPPSRARKLGLAAGSRVALLGLADAALEQEVEAARAERVTGRAAADLVFFGVQAPADLDRLAELRQRIEPAGAIWVVRTKGKAASVSEGAVRNAARSAGLVDVKVVAFSESQSADKLVVPVKERAQQPAARPQAKAAATKREAGAPAARRQPKPQPAQAFAGTRLAKKVSKPAAARKRAASKKKARARVRP